MNINMNSITPIKTQPPVKNDPEDVRLQHQLLTGYGHMTEAERRKAFNGFLYPENHPFSIFEGNYNKPSIFMSDKQKTRVTKSLEEVEEDKARHPVSMVNRKNVVVRRKAVGVLKK